ncbi:uncharacterized protein LOC108603754 [Drosophila busckii]|uniref:uncharacterized protein LOC108603754 n=1 Tax=Drosophila busckii TaxID=30019 RepID=UPI00083F4840|nr:uncharacterized protein LOC108603754 [Drosophila busckii]
MRAIYGNKERLVLSFEELGAAPLQLSISTPTYMIAQLRLAAAPNKTKDLTTELQHLGIRRHMRAPYSKAQYFVFPTEYYTLGENTLNITIDSLDNTTNKRQRQTLALKVHVVQLRATTCIPKVVFRQCMNPEKPRIVNIQYFTNIQAIVEHRCSSNDKKFTTMWQALSHDSQVSYFKSEESTDLLIKIPRYKLWYNELIKNYPTMLLTLKFSLREQNNPWTHTRCYLKVTAGSVVACIKGGHRRKVKAGQYLMLDGSRSEEPAYETSEQQLLFSWYISELDGANKQRLSYQSDSALYNLSSNYLSIGATKLITLEVVNRQIGGRSSKATQIVEAVGDARHVGVDIECVTNCHNNMYTPNAMLHVDVSCVSCYIPLSYTWTLNGVDAQQNKSHFIKMLDASVDGELVVAVTVNSRRTTEYAELKLQKLPAPVAGQCVMEPTSGAECQTKFQIECTGFEAPQQEPLLYSFKYADIYEEHIYGGETFLYLNGNDKLVINICGRLESCVRSELSFTVDPLELPKNAAQVEQFLEKHNLANLFAAGRRQEAFCILQRIAATATDREVVQTVYQTLKQDEIHSFLEVANMVSVAYTMVQRLAPMTNEVALVLQAPLKRALVGLDFVIEDTEIRDMTVDMCTHVSSLLTDFVSYGMRDNIEITHQEIMRRDFDDPLSEEYLDWERFDPTVSIRISRFITTMYLVFMLFHNIGLEAMYVMQVEEPFVYLSQNVSLKYQLFEQFSHIEHKPKNKDNNCIFHVPLSTVDALQTRFKTPNLFVTTWCFYNNIFWWAPDPWPPSTGVFMINLFGKNRNLEQTHNMQTDEAFLLELKQNKKNTLFDRSDYLYDNMRVYKHRLEGQVNLLVKFVNASAGLRVLITMNTIPTWPKLLIDSCYVPKGGQNTTIILKNRCQVDGVVYIAIYKMNLFDPYVTFTFRASAQECLLWDNMRVEPSWLRKHCYPMNFDQIPTYSKCLIKHMSIFAAKEFPVKPFSLQEGRHRHITDAHLPLNVGCVVFNIVLCLFGLFLLIMGTLLRNHKKKNLIRVIKTNDDQEAFSTQNIILHVRTGGMVTAFTTANVKMDFHSALGRYKVVIYQDPLFPQLCRNTSCMMRLSDEKLQLPCTITISHDNSGRYPTWYCQSIQLDDLRRDVSYTFIVHKWIGDKQKIILSSYPEDLKNLDQTQSQNCCKFFFNKFRYYTRMYYTNWFLLQPLLGPWRLTDQSWNLFERTCVWTCKLFVTVTIVFCYYRTTNKANYYSYKHRHDETSTSEFLALALLCYFVTLLVQAFFTHIVGAYE